ncbi:basic proline-rich protein-like [Choloepus didactylus]|uniref:basic proline-rich protein-like n=1 Tax=Choloepus didactylus TaxID=27675 RepID=UPI00189D4377|nr:basic proline-rich protein-like [Choloepus didactylus]
MLFTSCQSRTPPAGPPACGPWTLAPGPPPGRRSTHQHRWDLASSLCLRCQGAPAGGCSPQILSSIPPNQQRFPPWNGRDVEINQTRNSDRSFEFENKGGSTRAAGGATAGQGPPARRSPAPLSDSGPRPPPGNQREAGVVGGDRPQHLPPRAPLQPCGSGGRGPVGTGRARSQPPCIRAGSPRPRRVPGVARERRGRDPGLCHPVRARPGPSPTTRRPPLTLPRPGPSPTTPRALPHHAPGPSPATRRALPHHAPGPPPPRAGPSPRHAPGAGPSPTTRRALPHHAPDPPPPRPGPLPHHAPGPPPPRAGPLPHHAPGPPPTTPRALPHHVPGPPLTLPRPGPSPTTRRALPHHAPGPPPTTRRALPHHAPGPPPPRAGPPPHPPTPWALPHHAPGPPPPRAGPLPHHAPGPPPTTRRALPHHAPGPPPPRAGPPPHPPTPWALPHHAPGPPPPRPGPSPTTRRALPHHAPGPPPHPPARSPVFARPLAPGGCSRRRLGPAGARCAAPSRGHAPSPPSRLRGHSRAGRSRAAAAHGPRGPEREGAGRGRSKFQGSRSSGDCDGSVHAAWN